MAPLSLASALPLIHSSESIPVIGYGVYRISDRQCPAACQRALSAGYRQIDTAQLYNNEDGVGRGLKASDVPRSEVFVTTKIRYPRLGKNKTYMCVRDSVRKIGGRTKQEEANAGDDDKSYVDMFLLHTPYGVKKEDRKEMWLALEKLHAEGRARAIGVSNFEIEHIEEMKQYATIWPPAVNQLQLNPWHLKPDLVAYCKKHRIVIQAHSPLEQGEKLTEVTLMAIAKRTGKTAAQVLIRYSLQKGFVPLPKTEKESRMQENLDVFDFELTDNDMEDLENMGAKKP